MLTWHQFLTCDCYPLSSKFSVPLSSLSLMQISLGRFPVNLLPTSQPVLRLPGQFAPRNFVQTIPAAVDSREAGSPGLRYPRNQWMDGWFFWSFRWFPHFWKTYGWYMGDNGWYMTNKNKPKKIFSSQRLLVVWFREMSFVNPTILRRPKGYTQGIRKGMWLLRFSYRGPVKRLSSRRLKTSVKWWTNATQWLDDFSILCGHWDLRPEPMALRKCWSKDREGQISLLTLQGTS